MHYVSFRWKKFNIWEGQVGAWDRITASKMHWRVPYIICSLYVCVRYIRYKDCRGLVGAILTEAVKLINYNGISYTFHMNISKCHSWYWSWATLPCLDSNPVIWYFYNRVPHRYVWNTGSGVVISQTTNTELK